MAIDKDLLLRDGSAALTASELTPTALDFGGQDLTPLVYQVDVLETVDGTLPTLDVVIQGADTSGGTYYDIATFPRITAKGQYHLEAISKYRHRRAKCTVGGTNPDFHACQISVHPAGLYNER